MVLNTIFARLEWRRAIILFIGACLGMALWQTRNDSAELVSVFRYSVALLLFGTARALAACPVCSHGVPGLAARH